MPKELQAELPCYGFVLPELSIKKEYKEMSENPTTPASKLVLVKASDIKPKEVRWLWYPYIRAPVPVCGGVVCDAAASCFPGQYGWIRVCVEYA